ncbi:hypothetical protein HOJ01_01890 [bacterium]|jgi:hypothetical protein|nr:hypothetical protein [bacterium]MBT6293536.1 hypothetical protein [bacterium]
MTENNNPFDDTSQKVAQLLEEIDEPDDLKESKFEKILEELNLTKASFLKYVILIVLSVFLFNYFTSDRHVAEKDSSSESQVLDSKSEKSLFDRFFSKDDNLTPQNTSKTSSLDPVNQIGVLPAIKIKNIQTFTTSNKIAKANNLTLVLETYLLSYKKIKTLYDVDVRNYLDSKTNRQQAFDSYITEYVTNFELLKSNILKLQSEILTYKNKLEETSVLAKSLEDKFLNNVDNLNPYELDLTLQDFKEVNLRKTALTNELKSRQIVFDRIANRNDIIESRLKGLISNKDALIKGVTFTEVEGSNLNLSQ